MQHVYRAILIQALTTTWRRKELWIFGLFAGLLNTGSVLDVIFRLVRDTAQQVSLGQRAVHAIPGLTSLLQYLHTLALVDAEREIATGGFLVMVFVLLLLLALNGQANLFHELSQRQRVSKKRQSVRWWHPNGLALLRLFGLNVLWRLFLAVMHLFSTVTLSSFVSPDPAVQVLVNFSLFVVTIPLTLLAGCLTIFTMIEIVTKQKTVTVALRDAWQIMRHHLTAVTEVAMLLFLASLLGTLVLIGAIVLLTIPYLFLFLLSLTLGSLVLWMIVMLAASASVLVLILIFGGFLTSFVYATWNGAYQKFAKRTMVVSKLERLIVQLKLIR